MEVRKAIRERRSVRRFLEKEVEDKKVRDIIDAAQWAPSACNKQMWEFVVVRKEDVKRKLADSAKASAFIKNAPVAIYVLYRKDVNSEFQANVQSASAAIQNMLLAAHDIGLGAVWVADCGNRERVRDILGIPDSLLVVAAVFIGYPAAVPPAPKRRDMKDIMHADSFSGGKKARVFPEEWDEDTLSDYRSRGIRATSPTPEAFIPGQRKEFLAAMKKVSSFIPKEGNTLDVLPFAGAHLMEMMKNSDSRFHAYEVSEEMLDFIRRRKKASGIGKELVLKKGGIYRIPYGDRAFDCVTCINKLETVPDPERLMGEMVRVLKVGGTLILSFWNSRSIYGINYSIKTGARGRDEVTSNEGPVRPMSYGRVKRMLEPALKVEKRYGINLMPPMESMLVPAVLKSLCRVNILVCKRVK